MKYSLILALFIGTLSSAEAIRLDQLLREDPAAADTKDAKPKEEKSEAKEGKEAAKPESKDDTAPATDD